MPRCYPFQVHGGFTSVLLHVVLGAGWLVLPAEATAQETNRRNILKTPGLVLETGAPTAVTWALAFSGDGQHLLAAGDDHVVRDWPVTDKGLDTGKLNTLRWQTWREWRGAIYAMALSPDKEASLVAIAGWGAITSNVVILERKTAKVKYAINVNEEMFKAGQHLDFGGTTHALAFSPGGTELAIGKNNGTVWIWKFAQKGAQALRKVGSHGTLVGPGVDKTGKEVQQELHNFVNFVAFADKDTLISAAQEGQVLRWPATAPGKSEILARLMVPRPNVFAFHPASGQLAAAGAGGKNENLVELVALSGASPGPITLPENIYARALAFAPDGKTLALAVERPQDVWRPWLPIACEVHRFDLTKKPAAVIASVPASYNATALAFHPTRQLLAIAGGNDFELRLWDLANKKKLQEARSAGSALWGVAFSKDSQALGFRNRRKDQPTSYNDWSEGAWSVFDLKKRKWAEAPGQFRPVVPVEEVRGWQVDTRNKRQWYVVDPQGKRIPLPLVPEEDKLATCYSFIEPPDGGLQLAVGHRWGISIFAVTNAEVKRIRLGHGHAGEVTSVAPSADHKLLLSASRDQTISCWSLMPWPLERELGASFEDVGGQFTVKDVKAGSPAWEAGLAPGDQILDFKSNAKAVARMQWAATLAHPKPGIELYFEFKRPGVEKPLRSLTTVKQRPLWRFFPLNNREWVLWRWRDYFYDSSATGDSYIGWQVNGQVEDTPEFYKAEQFRWTRRFPEKVDEIMRGALVRPERVMIADLLPPKIDFHQDAANPLTFQIKVSDGGLGVSAEPRMVSLWINDYKYKSWAGRVPFQETVSIPPALLRHDKSDQGAGMPQNVIFVQAKNKDGNRGESYRKAVANTSTAVKPRLHGLFVGIGNYKKAALGPHGEFWGDLLFPVKDARAMRNAWEKQSKTELYEPGRLVLLTDAEASRQRILEELALLKKETEDRPDDRVILFFAGHGWAEPVKTKLNLHNADHFAFVCPQFDIRRWRETGLTSDVLYDYIVTMPARKLVFLDACHSGSVREAEYLRSLTPDGIGPPIFTAAERDQSAWEHPTIGHGVFTRAILDALGPEFEVADSDQNGHLNVRELAEYLRKRVPEIMDEIRPRLPAEDRGAQQRIEFYPPLDHDAPADVYQPLARGLTKN
jgi:WD40 repeat protein